MKSLDFSINKSTAVFWLSFIAIAAAAVYLRIDIPDYTRLGNFSDEAVYRNAAYALNAESKMVLIRDAQYFLTNDISTVPATANLNIGYPYFVSVLHSSPEGVPINVYIAQAVLSLLIALSVVWSLFLLNANRFGIIAGFLAVSLYPGLIHNVDRVLTDYLFTFLLLTSFCILLVGSKRTAGLHKFSETVPDLKSHILTILAFAGAGLFLGLSTQVRTVAIVFCPIIIVFIFVFLNKASSSEKLKYVGAYCGAALLTFLPFILYVYGAEGSFQMFPDTTQSPVVWGLVPYFYDMQATSSLSLEQIALCNKIVAPDIFRTWRVFGMLEFGWGQIWDENLRFDGQMPELSSIHYIAVVPSFLLAGLFLKRMPREAILVASVPVVLTVVYMQFHTLPRYMVPAVPFLIILFGCVMGLIYANIRGRLSGQKDAQAMIGKGLSGGETLAVKETLFAFLISRGASLSLIVLGGLILYSTLVFAWTVNKEVSKFELARYYGLTLEDLDANYVIGAQIVGSDAMVVENAVLTDEADIYISTDVENPIVTVPLILPDAPAGTIPITKVNIHMKMFEPFRSAMSVYFTRSEDPRFTERRVFGRYPINKFEDRQQLVFGDADQLTIVPTTNARSRFEVDYVEAVRYAIPVELQDQAPEYCKVNRF